MAKYRVAILKNESVEDYLPWITACEENSQIIDFDVIELVASEWLVNITTNKYDFFLTRPPGRIEYFKKMYDERVYIINKVLGLPIYPTLDEVLVYENKRLLSHYLEAREIPHAKTWVFYDKEDALSFAKNCELPIVAKTNIGAGGSGVKIFQNRSDIIRYIEKSFSTEGITRSYFPNLRKGDFLKRFINRSGNVVGTIEYFRNKKRAATVEPQKWFVLFQEYIKSDFEWRCVVINDSYFGHKKLRSFGEQMSGTSKVSWDVPDEELLTFLKRLVDKNNLWSQAIDLFYDKNKGYLVNELQCFWGSKNPHQMIKDGEPGRFIFSDNNWTFEAGNFNENNSFNLRLKHILSILDKNG